MSIAQRLLDELELARVGNPNKTVTQIQVTPDLYRQLLEQLGAPSDFGDVLTIMGIPVIVLTQQQGSVLQLVFGLTS